MLSLTHLDVYKRQVSYYFFIIWRIYSTSFSLKAWCIGKQMTLLDIWVAIGRLSGLAESNPRYVENVLISG